MSRMCDGCSVFPRRLVFSQVYSKGFDSMLVIAGFIIVHEVSYKNIYDFYHSMKL